jgi:ubiquinone/menaquinone biosynthesis C-methylase UbiE
VSSRRAADYDAIADGYDRRYGLHAYAGIERTLINFVAPAERPVVLEVGCGTGHWLQVLACRSVQVAGADPSAQMLVRARAAAPAAHLIRARAEDLPWHIGAFDRVFCINAAHHFGNRARFFVEARRVLKSGGGVLVAGREPPSEADRWWVYEYFEETRAIDRARYATGAMIQAEMAAAGFVRCVTREADRLHEAIAAPTALDTGVVDRRFTSQLSVLSDAAFNRGVRRLRDAMDVATAAGGELVLAADVRFEATIGWAP